MAGSKIKAQKEVQKNTKAKRRVRVRASISFSPKVYKMLELIAKNKKVSLAWVVRDAAEKYISDSMRDS